MPKELEEKTIEELKLEVENQEDEGDILKIDNQDHNQATLKLFPTAFKPLTSSILSFSRIHSNFFTISGE